MLLTGISYTLICSDPKCSGAVSCALMNAKLPVERLYDRFVIHNQKCSLCDKPYTLPHIEAKVDTNKWLREIKLTLRCKRCESTWNTSISTNNSVPLKNLVEELKNNTMCISPYCDYKKMKVLEARVA